MAFWGPSCRSAHRLDPSCFFSNELKTRNNTGLVRERIDVGHLPERQLRRSHCSGLSDEAASSRDLVLLLDLFSRTPTPLGRSLSSRSEP
ncbi:hypothetical protein KSP40_PGU019273 [Platanthera guangdongensis]|uniref:Uncharacterized protein n=1 Tax=Platanthera guangdongensis TaxID=2320717 RepID=A0ABR2M8E6_9ASPA